MILVPFDYAQQGKVSFGYKSKIKKVAKNCAYCKKSFSAKLKPTVEHILPRSKGGANNIKNYLAVCADCNNKRGNKNFKEWLKSKPSLIENIKFYLSPLKNEWLEGVDYVKEVSNTMTNQTGGQVSFCGNNRKINFIA